LIQALAKVENRDAPGPGESGYGERVTSLSAQPEMPEAAKFEGKDVTESTFFKMLEDEMSKVDGVTLSKVKVLTVRVNEIESNAGERVKDAALRDKLRAEAQQIGDEFLSLEKYANVNYLAIHKILKKHDKMLPVPCRRFYIMRIAEQGWVKHDYSKIFVRLSTIHSILRGDTMNNKDSGAAGQEFVRSTKKYWVRTEDISRVKHSILQHLPIFQHDLESLAGDSQLTNSVYFDNSQLELYHGRLDKTPGAIAVRFRWYATEEPDLVFVERKTHRDSWTGEVSVKERFTLKAKEILPFLEGKYTVEDKMKEMKAKNKPQADLDNVRKLFTEIYQQIDSKQLRPCMRTRYNRTAYQIPFDATVRISLDSNLTMLTENPKVGPSCATSGRWYRDPNQPLPPTEITRFPHAILEVKLSVKENEVAPLWVTDLIESGMLIEVHKFSKFIHGCATLLSESVRAVPYWVDDPSIRPSILRSQGRPAETKRKGEGRLPFISENKPASDEENDDDGQLDFGDAPAIKLMPRRPSLGGASSPGYGAVQHGGGRRDNDVGDDGARGGGVGAPPGLFTRMLATVGLGRSAEQQRAPGYKPRKVPMKVEPKTYFANERTMLSWLHMAVTLGTIGAAMLAVDTAGTRLAGMLLLPVAVLFALYAVMTFHWRSRGIAHKDSATPMHDMVGPTVLAIVLMLALGAVFLVRSSFSLSLSLSAPGTHPVNRCTCFKKQHRRPLWECLFDLPYDECAAAAAAMRNGSSGVGAMNRGWMSPQLLAPGRLSQL